MSISVTILDVSTDIMSNPQFLCTMASTKLFPVLSIPILILGKTQLKPTQKLGLGVFLCLSIVMVVVAIVRMSGYRIHGVGINGSLDTTWSFFWVYIEACVATIMASITAFRSLFVQGSAGVPDEEKNTKTFHFPRELLQRKICRSGWEVDREQSPKVASATHTGVETFIYHEDTSTARTIPMQSRLYSWDDGDQLRDETGPNKNDRIDRIYVDRRVESYSDRVRS